MTDPSPSSSMIIDDKYALLARVGRGATGEVYKARDVQSNEIVAVKLVDLEDAEDDVADIQREITLLAQCSSPYVTRYMSSTLVPGTSKLAIVMEYMAGGSARHALNEIESTSTNDDEHSPGVKGKGVSEGEIAYIMRDVLRALEYLHHEGKIHRDIKAANVLLTEKAEARLADFGVSGQMTHTLGARRKTFTGTPFWMAPEVIQGSEGIR
jgi:serine/threonine-protein kinase 24/25/MST4